jgi:hypothetical protein
MIKIDFEFDSQYGIFRDALHLPEDHSLTNEEIENIKKERFDSWINVFTVSSEEKSDNLVTYDNKIIDISGEMYKMLEGTPPSGAKLVEIENIWYVKVTDNG